MLSEVGHGGPEVIKEQGGHVLTHAQANQNALHGYVGSCSGEGVGRHLPSPGSQPVGQVEKGVAGVCSFADSPGDRRDASVRVAVTEELERAKLDDLGGEVLTDRIGRVVDAPVALMAETEEVVVLGDDLPGWAGEVDLEDGHVAAQVVHMEHQVVGEFLAVPPDDPPDAQGSQPELVPRGADRLNPWEAEVEYYVWCAERGQEGAAGTVHVNINIKASVGLQLIEGAGHGLHRFVGAGVGDAEGGHDHDRILVDPFQHRGWIHGVVAMRHRDFAHLDVPVAGELVPYHLHRTAHHVRIVRWLVFGLPPGAPPPPGRHACQHAS